MPPFSFNSFVVGDLQGRILSFLPGTIRIFNSYEEARQYIRIGGNRLFVGQAKIENNKLVDKNILWEDGVKSWRLGERLCDLI